MSVVTGLAAGRPACVELAFPTNVRVSNYARGKKYTRQKKLIGQKNERCIWFSGQPSRLCGVGAHD